MIITLIIIMIIRKRIEIIEIEIIEIEIIEIDDD